MSVSIADLQAMIGADLSGLEKGIKEAQAKLAALGNGVPAKGLDSFVDRARKSLSDFGASAAKVGTQISIGFALPLTVLAKKIYDTGKEYEQAMNVFQVATKATSAEMAKAAALAEALGNDIKLPGVSAADAAIAMTELGKAGFDVSQSMDGVRGVLELSTAATIGAADAAKLTTAALQAFGLQASESGRVSDLLAASATATSAEIVDVGMALQQSAASAAALKIPVDDLVTSISLMATAGIKGSDAGTSLKTFMNALTPSTKAAAAAMQELGIHAFDSAGRFVGLETVISQAAPALARMTDQQRANAIETAFGSDAQRAANIVLGAGVEKFKEMDVVVNKAGAAQEMAAAKSKGLSGAMEAFISTLETVAIKIFKDVGPGLESMVRKFGDIVGSLSSLNPEVVKAGAAFLAVFGAGGIVALAVGKTITALAALSVAGGVITLASTAVAGLAAAYASDFGTMNTIINNHFTLFRKLLGENQKAASTWGEEWSRVGIGFGVVFDAIVLTLEAFLSNLYTIGQAMVSALSGDWGGVVKAWMDGEARLDAISETANKNRQARNHARAELDFAAWSRHYDERRAQAAIGGAKIADAEFDALFKGSQKTIAAAASVGTASAKAGTDAFNQSMVANPIGMTMPEALMKYKGPTVEAAKALGLASGTGAANSFTFAWNTGTHHSPFIIVHQLMEAVADSLVVVAGFGKVGSVAGESLKKGAKGKGHAMAKAMLDEFQDGSEGLSKAIDNLTAQASKKGGFEFLFHKIPQSAKEAADKTIDELKRATDAINEFIKAAGSSGKIKPAELAKHYFDYKPILDQAEAYDKLKESIDKINLDRFKGHLSALDDTIKLNGNTIEISISTLRALGKESSDLIAKMQALGFKFKEVFPAMEPILAESERDIRAWSQSVNVSVVGSVKGFPIIKATVRDAVGDMIQASNAWFDKLVEGANRTQQEAPHWAGPIVDAADRIKLALEKDSGELIRMRAALDIRSSIDSAIDTFERYGEQLGKTGKDLENFVENGVRKELGKFKDITQAELDAAIEAHKRAAIRLPGIWEEVFGKLNSAAKSKLSGVLDIIGAIPGGLNKVTRQVEDWVGRIDTILKGLHKLFQQVPDGVGDMLGKVISIFKSKGQQAKQVSNDVWNEIFLGNWKPKLTEQQQKLESILDEVFGPVQSGGGVASKSASKLGNFLGGKILGGITGALAGTATVAGVFGSGMGRVQGGIQGALGGLMAGVSIGAMFGPLGAGIGAISGLVGGAILGIFGGGKTALQKAQEAAALQQAKDAIKISQQSVLKALEESKQSLLETSEKARQLLENLRFYDRVGKPAIKDFFKDLTLFMKLLAQEATKWASFAKGDIKTAAESLGAGVQVVGSLFPVLAGIGTYFKLGQGQLDIFFADADAFFDRLGEFVLSIPTKIQKRIGKFGTRTEAGIGILSPLLDFLKGALEIKPIPDSSFDIIESTLNKMVERLGRIGDSFKKSFLKMVGFVGENLTSGVSLLGSILSVIKDAIGAQAPSDADLDNIFSALMGMSTRMIAFANELSTEGLQKASAIATAILPVATALKTWAEASAVIRGYTSIAAETWDNIAKDFFHGLDLLTLLKGGVDTFETLSKYIADHITTAGDYLKNALVGFANAINVAASAINGAITLQSGLESQSFAAAGAFGTSSFGAGSFTAPSSFTPSSFTPSGAQGNSTVNFNAPIYLNGKQAPAAFAREFTDNVKRSLVDMQKGGELKLKVV